VTGFLIGGALRLALLALLLLLLANGLALLNALA
jgi:hypothetical protein